MTKKLTHEEVCKRIKDKYPDVQILSEYKDSKTKMKFRCKCGNEFTQMFCNFLKSSGTCNICRNKYNSDRQKFNSGEFASRVNADFEILTPYNGMSTKMKFRCKCGNEFERRAYEMTKRKPTCKKCYKRINENEFLTRLNNNNIDVQVLCAYQNMSTKMKFRCKCGNEFERLPSSLLLSKGICRQCLNKNISSKIQLPDNEIRNRIKEVNMIDSYNGMKSKHKFRCKCGNEFERILDDLLRYKNYNCMNCSKTSYVSKLNKEFATKLESYGLKTVLEKDHIDIVLPDYNIAIELCPSVSHNTTKSFADIIGKTNKKPNRITPKYHKEKFEKIVSLGYKPFFVWGWQLNKPIIFSMILAKCGLFQRRVYARQTTIKEVSNSVAKEFFSDNHIQGFEQSQRYSGIYLNDELLSVMAFRNNELTRFATLLNTQVIGGFQKLFKHMTIGLDKVISYSSNDYSIGDIYSSNGFELVSEVSPRYWWANNNDTVVHTRRYCQKKNISKKNSDYYNYDDKSDTRTEKELMAGLGFLQVFDCGKKKWVWKR